MAVEPYLGRAVTRLEDPPLLRGRGRFVDDLPVAARTAHAAIVRSPHAHARLLSVDVEQAIALDGVYAVLTGADITAWGKPFLVSVRAPMSNKQGAADLCMQFPTGGGRAGAAGINDLPAGSLDDFVAAFRNAYTS